MNDFLTSNEWQWRLLRTIAQGVLGVVVANIDLLVGVAVLEPTWRALVVALDAGIRRDSGRHLPAGYAEGTGKPTIPHSDRQNR